MTTDLSPSELQALGVDPSLATKADDPPTYTVEQVKNMSLTELRDAERRFPQLLNATILATENAAEAASFNGRARAAKEAEAAESFAKPEKTDAETVRLLDLQKFMRDAPDMDEDRRMAEAKGLGLVG